MSATAKPRVLGARDLGALRAMLALFADAFEDGEPYTSNPPDDAYLERLLSGDTFLGLVAQGEGAVVGGLAGYFLPKFEQARTEFYIYDLAVAEAWRRRGVATAMIEALKAECARRGVWVIYVQADYGDDPAVALYTKLGVREDVMHFDIAPAAADPGK